MGLILFMFLAPLGAFMIGLYFIRLEEKRNQEKKKTNSPE